MSRGEDVRVIEALTTFPRVRDDERLLLVPGDVGAVLQNGERGELETGFVEHLTIELRGVEATRRFTWTVEPQRMGRPALGRRLQVCRPGRVLDPASEYLFGAAGCSGGAPLGGSGPTLLFLKLTATFLGSAGKDGDSARGWRPDAGSTQQKGDCDAGRGYELSGDDRGDALGECFVERVRVVGQMKQRSECRPRGARLPRLAHEEGERSGLDLADTFAAETELFSYLRERVGCVLEADSHAQDLLFT